VSAAAGGWGRGRGGAERRGEERRGEGRRRKNRSLPGGREIRERARREREFAEPVTVT